MKKRRNKNRIRDKKNSHVYAKFTDDDIEVTFHHNVGWMAHDVHVAKCLLVCPSLSSSRKVPELFQPKCSWKILLFLLCFYQMMCERFFFSQNKKKRVAFSSYEDLFHTWDKESHEVDKSRIQKIMRRQFFDLNTTLMAI